MGLELGEKFGHLLPSTENMDKIKQVGPGNIDKLDQQMLGTNEKYTALCAMK